ncbi:MAG: CidA/LrgA family protein [Cellvibrionaceae bacterium]
MLKGLIVLLAFQLCGEALVTLTGTPVPGPVIGMLLLWLALGLKGGPSPELSSTSQAMIQNLSLFFLPAGVGLFFLPSSIQQYWPAVAAAMIGGTFLAMLFSGWLVKRLAGKANSS